MANEYLKQSQHAEKHVVKVMNDHKNGILADITKLLADSYTKGWQDGQQDIYDKAEAYQAVKDLPKE